MTRLGIERPAINRDTEAEIVQRAGLDDLREAIAAGLAMLPQDTREAITLRIVDELSYPRPGRPTGDYRTSGAHARLAWNASSRSRAGHSDTYGGTW
jgi:hypothetical protein